MKSHSYKQEPRSSLSEAFETAAVDDPDHVPPFALDDAMTFQVAKDFAHRRSARANELGDVGSTERHRNPQRWPWCNRLGLLHHGQKHRDAPVQISSRGDCAATLRLAQLLRHAAQNLELELGVAAQQGTEGLDREAKQLQGRDRLDRVDVTS